MQLNLLAGERAKQDGLTTVAATNKEFLETCRRYARAISALKGEVSIDDVRAFCDEHSLKPEHPNAFGAIFKNNGWLEIGRKKSCYETNHARKVSLWRWIGEG